MTGFDYAFHHVECTWRLIRGDAAALADMDLSADGFWRSFSAIAWSIPALFFMVAVDIRLGTAPTEKTGTAGYVVLDAIFELAVWLIPVFVLYYVLRALKLQAGYTALIIARNWFFLIVNYVFAALYVPALIIGENWPPALLILAAIIGSMMVLALLTRVTTGCSSGTATVLVVAEFVFGMAFGLVFFSAVGGFAQPV